MVGLGCWTGTRWRSVGEVADVSALAVHGGRLWLGGSFHSAGGIPAWHLTNLVVDDAAGQPDQHPARAAPVLGSPAPNPFNPKTWISFELPSAADVCVEVFDARGRRIVRLVDDHREAGTYVVPWDGHGGDGRTQPSGVYLVRLEAGRHVSTVKMTLTR